MADLQEEDEVVTEVFSVPPFIRALPGLKHATNYSVRVQCSNEMGNSPFSDWVYFQTLGLGKT